jgi:hypothetical protein
LAGLKIRFVSGSADVSLEDGEALHDYLNTSRVPHEYEMLLDVPHNQDMYYERSGRTASSITPGVRGATP